MKAVLVRLSALPLFAAASCFAQQSMPRPAAAPAQAVAPNGALVSIAGPNVAFASAGFGGMPQGVKGKPWSGEETTERVQTLADGTHINEPARTTRYWRDSEGRTRTESVPPTPPSMMNRAGVAPPAMVQITDPVAGVHYNWSSNDRVAHRFKMQTVAPPPSGALGARVVQAPPAQVFPANPPAPATQPLKPETTRESLGQQAMEGVSAEGTRVTEVYPVGFFGNDRPIAVVRETWMSPELGRAVLMKVSDPRTGESTTKLTGISLAEPDPTLFQPPADYEIKDNTPLSN